MASFGAEQQEMKKYVAHLDESKREGLKSALRAGSGIGVFWVAMFLAYGIGFYVGGLAIRNNWHDTHGNIYTAGQILTVFFSVIFGMFSLGMAAPNLRAMGEGIAAGTLIFSIIERKPKLNYARYDDSINV